METERRKSWFSDSKNEKERLKRFLDKNSEEIYLILEKNESNASKALGWGWWKHGRLDIIKSVWGRVEPPIYFDISINTINITPVLRKFLRKITNIFKKVMFQKNFCLRPKTVTKYGNYYKTNFFFLQSAPITLPFKFKWPILNNAVQISFLKSAFQKGGIWRTELD